MIYPYVKNTQVFFCPSDRASAIAANAFKTDSAGTAGTTGLTASYAINSAYYSDGAAALNATSPSCQETLMRQNVKLSALEAPSTTLWVTEGSYFQFFGPGSVISTSSPRTLDTPGSFIPERHLDTVNVLYSDGHVKATKLEPIFATGNNANLSVRKMLTIQADPD